MPSIGDIYELVEIEKKIRRMIYATPITELGFGKKAEKILLDMGITRIGDLARTSSRTLVANKKIGKVLISEIGSTLARLDLPLNP